MSNVFQTVLMTEQRKFWTHRGVQCAVHYHPHTQTMCGYCLIPAGHPLEDSDNWNGPYVSEELLDVHGGVTFGPAPVQGGHVVGFDTMHLGDWSRLDGVGRRWSLDDVAAETNHMADQIADWQETGEWVSI